MEGSVGAAKHVGLALHQERLDLFGFGAGAGLLRQEVEERSERGVLVFDQHLPEAVGVVLERAIDSLVHVASFSTGPLGGGPMLNVATQLFLERLFETLGGNSVDLAAGVREAFGFIDQAVAEVFVMRGHVERAQGLDAFVCTVVLA